MHVPTLSSHTPGVRTAEFPAEHAAGTDASPPRARWAIRLSDKKQAKMRTFRNSSLTLSMPPIDSHGIPLTRSSPFIADGVTPLRTLSCANCDIAPLAAARVAKSSKSAPVNPRVRSASSGSHSAVSSPTRGKSTFRMASRCSAEGGKRVISRSKRPARRSAGSRSKGRVVVARTRTRGVARRPSIAVRSCATTWTLVWEAWERRTQRRSMSSRRRTARAAGSAATTAAAREKRSKGEMNADNTLDGAGFGTVGGGKGGGGEGLEEEVEIWLTEGDGGVDLERRGRGGGRCAFCRDRGRQREEGL